MARRKVSKPQVASALEMIDSSGDRFYLSVVNGAFAVSDTAPDTGASAVMNFGTIIHIGAEPTPGGTVPDTPDTPAHKKGGDMSTQLSTAQIAILQDIRSGMEAAKLKITSVTSSTDVGHGDLLPSIDLLTNAEKDLTSFLTSLGAALAETDPADVTPDQIILLQNVRSALEAVKINLAANLAITDVGGPAVTQASDILTRAENDLERFFLDIGIAT